MSATAQQQSSDPASTDADTHPSVRRPIAPIAVAFTIGTALGLSLPSLLPAFAATAWFSILTALAFTISRKETGFLSTILLLMTAVSTAATFASLRAPPPPDPVVAHLARERARVSVEGIVTDEPVPEDTGKRRTFRFPLSVQQISGIEATSTACRVISPSTVWVRCVVFDRTKQPRFGDRWMLTGRIIEQPVGERRWMKPRWAMTTSSSRGNRLAVDRGNAVFAWCLNLRSKSRTFLEQGISDFREQSAVLQSLVLGYRTQIPRELYSAFARTGTLHIFAISGSHVAVIAGIIIVLLQACAVPRTRWILVIAPLLAVYTIMTGLQPSATRACVMAIVYWTAGFLNRRSDAISALAASAVILLVIDPSDLYDIGFILSFVAVIGITLLYPVIISRLKGLSAPDPLRIQPETPAVRTMRSVTAMAAPVVAMSTAAWIASAPLTAYYFNVFSPIGLPGNLVVVPLAGAILTAGMLSLVLGPFSLAMADIFNHANLALVSLLTTIVRSAAAVPYGNIDVASPPLWTVWTYYALLFTAAMLWRQRNRAAQERT